MAGEDAETGECDIDLVTGKVVLSPFLADLFGLAGTGSSGLEDMRARIHPKDRQRIAAETKAALDDPATTTFSTRFRICRDDASVVWLEARDIIARDRAGRALRTSGVMRAVKGRKPEDPPPDHGLQRFETALANTSVVLFQQDLALRYTWMHNPKLGFAAQSVLGRSDSELTGPALARPIEALKRRVLATGRSLRQEVTMRAGGARTRYDLHVEPQRDGSGAIVGVTGAAIEIAGERGKEGGPTNLRQAISDRDALLDRIGVRSGAGIADRGLFTICIEVLCRKLGGYAHLAREDAALLGLLERKRRFVPARHMIQIDEAQSWLVGNGWVYSYKSLVNGERQVLGFHLPGDLIGGDGRGGGRAASYAAVTDCVLCEFDRGMVMKLRRAETVLPDALRWADARDDAIVQQQLISIGRRSAIARVAHLLLELGARLKLVGLADDQGYDCPLSQELIADALGLTKIHVNRMLRDLRERGCLTLRNGRLAFGDMASLIRLAEYDPDYLDQRVVKARANSVMPAKAGRLHGSHT